VVRESVGVVCVLKMKEGIRDTTSTKKRAESRGGVRKKRKIGTDEAGGNNKKNERPQENWAGCKH